jgi:hypothetical protein
MAAGCQAVPRAPPVSNDLRKWERKLRELATSLGLTFKKPRSHSPQSPRYGRYWLLTAAGGFAAGDEHVGVPLAEIERVLAEVKDAGGYVTTAEGGFAPKPR